MIYHRIHRHGIRLAADWAAKFESLSFFSHALELLLQSAVESETGGPCQTNEAKPALKDIVEFLDYFPQVLEVVVACARKMEMKRWNTLFTATGRPRVLFEVRFFISGCFGLH